jgi:tRNA threonylcarbamoyl adenosine modification protein (Sua5/YciO/YrdC/YwlC family)
MEFVTISDGLQRAKSAAIDSLTDGGVVVLPTDTVYGVFALPRHEASIARIFSLKRRPGSMPLPLLIAGIDQLPLVSSYESQKLTSLLQAFWPGPLTVVLPNPLLEMSVVVSEMGTIAVRCPDNRLIRQIAGVLGPLAATSANVHGEPTPESASEIAKELAGVDLVVDGGVLKDGLASTLVDLSQSDTVILREGPIKSEAILNLV